MHENSLLAWAKIRSRSRAKRAQEVLKYIKKNGRLTDRMVATGMNYSDLNCVRPRISELIKARLVIECDPIKDKITNVTVRTVKAI